MKNKQGTVFCFLFSMKMQIQSKNLLNMKIVINLVRVQKE